MSEKQRTIDHIKKSRNVPSEVRERVKELASIRKEIRKALSDEPLTIPEIAEKTSMRTEEVTYYLLTMRKFGEIEVVDDDDVDEYYSYRIKG